MSAVGTATWGKRTFNVARVSPFDERDKYYLGACGENSLRCEFREVFESFAGYGSFRARKVPLQVGQGVPTRITDGMAAYVFDGKVGYCDTGFCEEVYCVGENP